MVFGHYCIWNFVWMFSFWNSQNVGFKENNWGRDKVPIKYGKGGKRLGSKDFGEEPIREIKFAWDNEAQFSDLRSKRKKGIKCMNCIYFNINKNFKYFLKCHTIAEWTRLKKTQQNRSSFLWFRRKSKFKILLSKPSRLPFVNSHNSMLITKLHKKLKTSQPSTSFTQLSYSKHFNVFSKPRMAKITKNLVDFIAQVPNSERLQI